MAIADAASALQWKPLARTRTHEKVVAEIEQRLIAGQLGAGDRLPPERQFAEALGVSRGAVREALRILEAVGVIEASTGSGPSAGSVIVKDSAAGMAMVLRLHLQVASFTRADLLEVRQMVAQLAAHKAAGSANAEDVAALRSLAERMHEVRVLGTFDDLEAQFHARLAQIADNGLAAILSSALRDADDTGGGPDDRVEQIGTAAADYALVVDAIDAGDAPRAAALLTAVLQRSALAGPVSALKRAG